MSALYYWYSFHLTKPLSFTELHLLKYKQQSLEYLTNFKAGRHSMFDKKPLAKFSPPTDENNYGDIYITNNLITDLYLNFVAKTRKKETINYCKTQTAIL